MVGSVMYERNLMNGARHSLLFSFYTFRCSIKCITNGYIRVSLSDTPNAVRMVLLDSYEKGYGKWK